MILNFYIESNEREKFKEICTGAIAYLRGLLLSEEQRTDTALGMFFMPYRLTYLTRGLEEYPNYTDDELNRARDIDSIARLAISVNEKHDPHSFVSCGFRINDDEVSFDEMKPHSHEHGANPH